MVKVLDDEKSFFIHYGGPAPPSAGNIWIVKGDFPSKLFLYDSNGILLNIIDIPIFSPWSIEVDREEDFLWLGSYKVDRVGNIIGSVVFNDTGGIYGIRGMAEDNEHNLWLSYDLTKIAKFTKTGNRLTKPFETPNDIYGLTFDPAGFLWLSEGAVGYIRKYSLDGNLVKTISSPRPHPFGIGMDAYNYLWVNAVVPFVEGRLWRINHDGEVITSFPLHEDLYYGARDIAVEPVAGGA